MIKCDDVLKVNKETLWQAVIPVILILSTFLGPRNSSADAFGAAAGELMH